MIPDEAVVAAHAAICEENLDDCLEWRGKCVKAVEAAAPFIRSDAKREALEEAAQAWWMRGDVRDRFTPWSWLNDRAAAVRGEG